MLVVPIQPLPNQNFQATLGGQQVSMTIFQTDFGLFANIVSDNRSIVNGVICEDNNRLVRDAYLGFIGDMIIVDTQGSDDPIYTGLGSRWQLIYLEAADIA